MRARSSRSLTRTTLYRIAAGVTVIIALATGIGYELLSREVGRRVLERLSEYVVQRAKYHGSYLTLIRDHHRVIKAELLRRYAVPMPDADERFERLMMRYPDGAWRNRPEYLDPKRYSTGWIHKKVQPTPELRRLWMLFFDLSEQFGRVASARYSNFYFVPIDEPHSFARSIGAIGCLDTVLSEPDGAGSGLPCCLKAPDMLGHSQYIVTRVP